MPTIFCKRAAPPEPRICARRCSGMGFHHSIVGVGHFGGGAFGYGMGMGIAGGHNLGGGFGHGGGGGHR
jgi:hypothetical protein